MNKAYEIRFESGFQIPLKKRAGEVTAEEIFRNAYLDGDHIILASFDNREEAIEAFKNYGGPEYSDTWWENAWQTHTGLVRGRYTYLVEVEYDDSLSYYSLGDVIDIHVKGYRGEPLMFVYDHPLTQKDLDVIATYMDDDIREAVHAELAPCEPEIFLDRYLHLDPPFRKLLETEFNFREIT